MDTVNNILAMKVDMVVMRHPHRVPINFGVEGGCAHCQCRRRHPRAPTQALLDTFSLREALGEDLTGKNIAIVGTFSIHVWRCPTSRP